MKPLTVQESHEWLSAADWCAARGLDGGIGCRLPELLSRRVFQEINFNHEEFMGAVRTAKYARLMERI